MPLPTVIFIVFATGLAVALAGRAELRASPRPALLTRSSLSYMVFDALVLVPACAYFYVFHGDWFMVYMLDVNEIPSAVALLGFLALGVLGVAGVALGAGLVRAQRETLVSGLLIGSIVLAAIAAYAARDRLSVVGSFAQYRGHFGLVSITEGALPLGLLGINGILLLGLCFLLVRVWMGARRQA